GCGDGAGPTGPRYSGWSRACSVFPSRRRPTTPPTPSLWPSATPARPRVDSRSPTSPGRGSGRPRPSPGAIGSRASSWRPPGAKRHPGRPPESGAMIAPVSGEVLVRRPDYVVIDASGVGYRLAVSAETLKSVPARGKRTSLHAHLVAREDSLSLYGFSSEEERDLFLHLISVGGVG